MNFNKVIAAGNLTRDPEMRFTPKGMGICKFGMAVNRRYKTEAGEQKDEATFFDVDCFGKTAELIAQYFKKGSTIMLEGRLKLDQWEDKKTGQKMSKLGVVMESFQFVGKREGAAPAPAPARGTNPNPPSTEDSEVPF